MLCLVQFLGGEEALKIGWIMLGFVVVCLACSSNDDAGEGKGPLATGGSGGSTGGSAGAAGSAGFSNGGAAVTCTTSADCVTTEFVKPIESLEDCYCVGCPSVALNADEDDLRRSAWEEFCPTWVPPDDPGPCALVKCTAPPESTCEAGVCTLIN